MNLSSFSKNQRIAMAHKWNEWVTQHYENEINHSIQNTIHTQENDVNVTRFQEEPKYDKTESFLVDLDTVSCLFKYQESGYKMAVLNFASYKNPGGMFLNGSSAQEEALCHQSTLYPVLCAFRENYYAPHMKTLNRALYEDDALYSKDIRFFDYDLKENNGKFLWHQNNATLADVITCAAPNVGTYCRYNGGNYLSDECMNAVCGRIITVLNAAIIGKCDDLVLGAFGCGVFKNDPTTIADYFMDYIADDYKGFFRHVYYAIPKSASNNNYEAFKEIAECEAYGVTEIKL